MKEIYNFYGKSIEFDLPLYIPPFELRRLPNITMQVVQESLTENRYLIETHKMSTLTNGVPNLTAFFCHLGSNDIDKLKLLIRIYLCVYYQDDQSDIKSIKRNNNIQTSNIFNIIKKIFNNEPVDYRSYPAVFRILLDGWSEISKNYSDIQRKRLMKFITYHYQEVAAETSLMNGEKSQEEVKHILFDIKPGSKGFGYRNRGVGITIQLNEYALGIEIKESHWNDELFQEFLNLCGRTLALWNDIVSFRKEVIEINGQLEKSPNFISYYATQPGFTLQDAVDKVIDIIHQTDNKIVLLRKELKVKYENELDMILFIDETVNIISLGWIYHLGNERYFGRLDGFPPLNGHFIFDLEKTIIIPPNDYNIDHFLHYKYFLKQLYNFKN